MITDFITEICELLNIEAPRIIIDSSKFQSKTTMAQCSQDGKSIYLKEREQITPDLLFSVAHELRHVWQIKVNKDLYFANYLPVNLCHSLEEYNLQAAEIDANAFAGLIMVEYFQLAPQFEGLNDLIKNKIYERMEEIVISL